eukprot:355528-Chlamydomonas_euryale.AAC.8
MGCFGCPAALKCPPPGLGDCTAAPGMNASMPANLLNAGHVIRAGSWLQKSCARHCQRPSQHAIMYWACIGHAAPGLLRYYCAPHSYDHPSAHKERSPCNDSRLPPAGVGAAAKLELVPASA